MPQTQMDTLGTRLESLLERRGVSQSQLARQLAIDQTAISRIIVRENYQPGAFVLYKIAKALGTTVDSLLDGIIEVNAPATIDTSIVARFGNEIASLKQGQAQLTQAIEMLTERLASLPEKKAPAKVSR